MASARLLYYSFTALLLLDYRTASMHNAPQQPAFTQRSGCWGALSIVHRLFLAEHDVDEQVDIGHVDLLVIRQVGGAHALGRSSLAKHDVDEQVDIGHIDRAIAGQVAGHCGGVPCDDQCALLEVEGEVPLAQS